MSRPAERLSTVNRAVQLLLFLAEEPYEWTLTELARRLEISKSMASRLINTLIDHDLVMVNPESGRYQLGFTILRLGQSVMNAYDIRKIADPIMEELAQDTLQSCILTVIDKMEAVSLYKIDSPAAVRVTFQIGSRSPLHAGASAKVLLAHMPREAWNEVLEQPLSAFTDQTVTDPDVLKKQLEQVRRQGYCFTEAELDQGLAAIAVPIRDHRGRTIAGISIVGLSHHFSDSTFEDKKAKVLEAAGRISRMLGWSPVEVPSLEVAGGSKG